MYPILLSLGPVRIYTFGLFLLLAVIVGSFVVWREGRLLKPEKVDEEKLIDLLLLVGLWGLIGSRIFYLALHYSEFGFSPFRWLLIFHFPGLTFLGGLIGGIFGAWVFIRKNHWSFWQTGDLLVLGLSLGEAIGRVGAFFSGSAYGSLTNLPWGVPMVGLVGRRHPSQLYEALTALLIFLILIKLKKVFAEKNLVTGLLFLLYFFLFGLSHFFLEFLRGDSVYFNSWRINQPIFLVFILFSGALFYKRLGRSINKDLASFWGGLRAKRGGRLQNQKKE